jgi:hypothetical protein
MVDIDDCQAEAWRYVAVPPPETKSPDRSLGWQQESGAHGNTHISE